MLSILLADALERFDGLGDGVADAALLILGLGFLFSLFALWFLVSLARYFFLQYHAKKQQ